MRGFQKLGAVGYTRAPVVELGPPGRGGAVFAFRMWLSGAIQARMPDDVAGFAAAVTTGDRSGIPKETVEALRISNLAHLLAISGLHMGLLAGFVFAVVRMGLALVPVVSLRINTKKTAAVVALLASAGYLVLSGGSVSTERAFVMTAVMLLAVLVDRRALSLRAVAVAALVVLVLKPEALLGPGFQMSFAATTALVVAFGWLRDREIGFGPKWLRAVGAVFGFIPCCGAGDGAVCGLSLQPGRALWLACEPLVGAGDGHGRGALGGGGGAVGALGAGAGGLVANGAWVALDFGGSRLHVWVRGRTGRGAGGRARGFADAGHGRADCCALAGGVGDGPGWRWPGWRWCYGQNPNARMF